MRNGSIAESADSLGILAAIGAFISLQVVLGVDTFLSMVVGLIVGFIFAFVCKKSKEKEIKK